MRLRSILAAALTAGLGVVAGAPASAESVNRDCRVVTSFSNACGAVASDTSKRYAVGEGVSEQQAEADTIANCTKAGGTECDIEAWSCTGR